VLSYQQQVSLSGRIREVQAVTGTEEDVLRKDRVERVKFYDHLKNLCDKLLTRQQSLWRGYYQVWLRNALYYDGKQVLVERRGGGYDIRQIKGLDQPVYIYNKLRPYSDEVTAMHVQSNPEVRFSVMDQDERRARQVIDDLNALNDYFNHRDLTEEVRQRIAKAGQFCGNYHFETWYDKDAGDGYEWFEEYAPAELTASEWYECLDCGQMGEMPQMGACPHCGSAFITPHQMPGVQFDALQNQGWKQTGDVITRDFPAWSMRYSLTCGAEESPWRYAEEDVAKEYLEAKFGKLDGTAENSNWAEDESMHPARVMRRAVRQRTGYEAEDDVDFILAQRFWLEPEMLANLALSEPARLPDGTEIPPDERLADVFPQGMCILTAPGLPRFLAVEHESHKERFIDGRYGITTGINIGQGIEDGVEMQRQTNLLRSGTFRYLQKTLQPSIAVNNRVFQNPQLFNRVDHVISLNNGSLPEGTTIGQHFAHVSPPPVNPQVFGVVDQLSADMQAALKAYNSSGDFAGVDNSTATAAKLGAAKAATAHNLHLALYAGALKELAVRRLLLAQKHYQNLRLVHTTDAETNERKARQINAVDIRTNFVAWVKVGSFMPNLDMQKREAFALGVEAIAQLAPLNLLNPGAIRQINEIFQTDFSFERQSERIEECEETLDLMLRAAEQTGGMVLPEQLYTLAPVDPYAIGHDAKIQWWREWLSSKEGRTAPLAVREAVKLQINAEYAAFVTEQQMLAQAAAAGTALLGPAAGGSPADSPSQSTEDQSQPNTEPGPMPADPSMGPPIE